MQTPAQGLDSAVTNLHPSSQHTKQAKHGKNVRMSRKNFPLPKELRDHIYSYLLDGATVKYDKSPGTTAYDFDTAIMAVNSELHAETTEYLYRKNTFVVVSYNWADLEQLISFYNVPHVTSKSAARMKHHSLRMHFGSTYKRLVPELTHMDGPILTHVDPPLKSVLLLLEDLPALIHVMRIQLHKLSINFTCVTTEPGDEDMSCITMGAHTNIVPRTQTRVEFRNTAYKTCNPALQEKLTKPLRALTGSCQKVKFTGAIADRAALESLKDRMAPSLVWSRALFWDLYLTLRESKRIADTLALRGAHEKAADMYKAIVLDILSSMSSELPQPELDRDPAAVAAQDHFDVLVYDCCLTHDFLNLRTGASRKPMLPGCGKIFEDNDVADASRIHLFGLSIVMLICTGKVGDDAQIALRQARGVIKTAVALVPEDQYARHDFAVLENCRMAGMQSLAEWEVSHVVQYGLVAVIIVLTDTGEVLEASAGAAPETRVGEVGNGDYAETERMYNARSHIRPRRRCQVARYARRS